jgi:zinc and cadmium transporter
MSQPAYTLDERKDIHMANYGHILFFSLIGGVFSLLGGFLLLSNKKGAEALAKYATPFAAGALLAAVFLDLLKEGVAEAGAETVLLAALSGVLLFFFLERFLGWFHHHHQHTEKNSQPGVSLIVAGDTMHNALDGVAIAAAFLISVPTGIVTTIAVAAHEIPQEIGDFGLLLSKGVARGKVLLLNVLSALATTVLALITFALGSADKLPIGVLLGLSAGFLLYIAMSDVIPTIHESAPRKKLFDLQPLMLLIGVITVGLSIQLAHQYIDAGHEATEEPGHHLEIQNDQDHHQ